MPSPSVALLSILPGPINSHKKNLLRFFLSAARHVISQYCKIDSTPPLYCLGGCPQRHYAHGGDAGKDRGYMGQVQTVMVYMASSLSQTSFAIEFPLEELVLYWTYSRGRVSGGVLGGSYKNYCIGISVVLRFILLGPPTLFPPLSSNPHPHTSSHPTVDLLHIIGNASETKGTTS